LYIPFAGKWMELSSVATGCCSQVCTLRGIYRNAGGDHQQTRRIEHRAGNPAGPVCAGAMQLARRLNRRIVSGNNPDEEEGFYLTESSCGFCLSTLELLPLQAPSRVPSRCPLSRCPRTWPARRPCHPTEIRQSTDISTGRNASILGKRQREKAGGKESLPFSVVQLAWNAYYPRHPL
jgi:hypothetical protein